MNMANIIYQNNLRTEAEHIASGEKIFTDASVEKIMDSKPRRIKEIIISMGMGGNKKKIGKIFAKNKSIFCYCVSDYPLKFEKINWKEAVEFDGLSDHTMDILSPILFTVLKKQKNTKKIYIEKHVKLENSKGPDASTSISTEKLSNMIKQIRLIEKSEL